MLSPKQIRRIHGQVPNLNGAVLLGGTETNIERVRNVGTGRVLPCCYGDCEKDGDNRYRVQLPHDNPERKGENLVYIFCSPTHKSFWMSGLPTS